MRTTFRSLLLGGVLAGALAAPAAAQDGFALKGNFIYNRAAVEGADRIPSANGFGLGAEYVLPMGLGLGISGYTGGRLSEFDRDASSLTLVAEANYFLRLPLIPLAPYAGIHAGIGQYSREGGLDTTDDNITDDIRQYGYQLGARLQLTPLIGLDAQYRRVSTSLQAEQDSRFSRDQVLVGITLF